LKHDDDIATIEKPPNHEVFHDVPTRSRSASSPLLERRLQNMKNTPNQNSAMPVIHVHIPGATASGSGQIPSSAPSTTPSSSLMPPNTVKLLKHPKMGPDLNVEQFCHLYDLGTEILKRLKDNGYQKTKTFKHITISQLQEMSLSEDVIELLIYD
jgi:hypothetical protein